MEKNWTDPKVCHDPSYQPPSIVKELVTESVGEDENEHGLVNPFATHDTLKVDGISYPLVNINDRNIAKLDLLYFKLKFTDFLPEVIVKIKDPHKSEININTTQMSGSIRVCIVPVVDKVYKKILMCFRIYDVEVNDMENGIITYRGLYDMPGLRQTNTGLIWMPIPCPKPITCQQGGHLNANTWEMLHKIASLSGLGFAATKQTKEIEDRVYRNIHTQRFDEYIKQQLKHSGTDENNIMDAWIDPYHYIVLVNVPWVLNQNVSHKEFDMVAIYGTHSATHGTSKAETQVTERLFTNFNKMYGPTNMTFSRYSIKVDNNAVHKGTLERIYTISWDGITSKLDTIDIQTKQNSIDGKYLEDYNTGLNRPIPKFNFNEGGPDLNLQKTIREHFFKKRRQSLLYITLDELNLGIQRGTLIEVEIFEQDVPNKKIINYQETNLIEKVQLERDGAYSSSDPTEEDEVNDPYSMIVNAKLTDFYYVDGIEFEYSSHSQQIEQTLILIKKGHTSGYNNKHTLPRSK